MKPIPWLKLSLLVGGLIWIGRAALDFTQPRYYDPRTLLDYTAVIGSSLAYLLLAAALWGLSRQQSIASGWKQRIWLAGIFIAVVAAGLVGIANFIEDALGLKAFGDLFFIGGIGLVLGLVLASVVAFLQGRSCWWLGFFLLACMAGIGLPDSGGGFVTGAAFLITGWRM